MEKHLERIMEDVVNSKNVYGCVFADHQGLCLGAKGKASTESAGLLVALTEQIAKLEPQSGLPVLVLENENRSCIIQRSGTITEKGVIKMDINTELRKIGAGYLYKLVDILELDESWKRLMAIIPKALTDSFESRITINNLPKYNTEHFKLIENAGNKQRRSCTEILFEEWGTSGRIRPKLGHLLRLLERAELYRAADYVAVELLNFPTPERSKTGPAAKIEIDLNDFQSNNEEIERILDEINYPSSLLNTDSSNVINNNYNKNSGTLKRIIPKIVINDASFASSNMDNNQVSSVDNSTRNSIEASLNQMEKKIEKYRHSPSIPENENLTESTDINSSVSDMIKFSSDVSENSSTNLPNLTDLMHEAHNPNLSAFSQILNNSSQINTPAFSQILNSNSSPVSAEELGPAFSQILDSNSQSNNNLELNPAFSQIFDTKLQEESNSGISQTSNRNSDFNPAFSQIMTTSNTNLDINPAFSQILDTKIPTDLNTNLEISPASQNIPAFNLFTSDTSENLTNPDLPHISALLSPGIDSNSNKMSRTLSAEKVNSSEMSQSRKTSVSSRTCASPLPNLSLNTVLPHFTYSELESATNCFDETMLSSHHSVYECEPNGRKLGSGAFGSVYLALGLFDKPVAVKKLNLDGVNVVNIDDTITKQFRNEVEILCKYKHDNLLSLLGYSCDGPTYCLIYEYICGGALKDRLQGIENRLIWTNRLYIALGTARAVSYLHNAYSMPLIHRDIKSANILLDNADKPKVTHVEDVCEDDIKPLLDTKAGSWILQGVHFGEQLYEIVLKCLEEKKRRPLMTDVVAQLSQLIDKAN